jgi:thiamine-monophosphate kinase
MEFKMKLREIGELGFIDRIKNDCIYNPNNVVQGIGDDCSVYKMQNGKVELVTTDLLIENVDFLNGSISPFDLGYKSLAVNLSDIAAMGGIPLNFYISIAIPKDIELEFLEDLYSGMKSLAKEYSVNLLGGDTSASYHDLVINIVVIGEMPEEEVVYRQGAHIGDFIYLTGYVGDSAGGLDIILSKRKNDSEIFAYLLKQHFRPYPYLKEGRWLASKKMATSMIDVSDGVASDLGHICTENEVGAILYEDKLPISAQLKEYVMQYKLDHVKLSLFMGEDYVLLFTTPYHLSVDLEKTYQSVFGKELYKIGQITHKRGIQLIQSNGQTIPIPARGWDHFK